MNIRTNLVALFGLLLVALGGLLLLGNLGFLSVGVGLLFGVVFGAGGLVFLAVYASDRGQWWALIPGCALLGIGLLITLGEVAPRLEQAVGGSLFLAMLSLPFWLITLTRREHWWALVPAGVLLTLALVAAMPASLAGGVTGGVFFLGLAATFGALYLWPTPAGRMTWAWIPAAALAALGALVILGATALAGYVWPLVLLAAGALLLARALRRG